MTRIVSLLGAVVLALAGCRPAAQSCAVCQRAECRGLTFQVELANGKTVATCCPRCGLLFAKSQQVRHLWATDFSSGRRIDATTAVYVEASDVSHCAAMETKRDAYGCCFYKGFDRCQPSLLAFADRAAAVKFQQVHGGQVVTLEKVSR